jgi:terminase large subunit-like protein
MFESNSNLRGVDEKIEYTPEQIKECLRCEEDIIYFAEKYFYIISIDKGEIKIPLREYQKKVLKAFINPPRRHTLLSQPRQSAKTTTTSIYMLHFILFNSDKNVAVLANKEDTAKEILERVKFAYERLPLFLQKGIKEWNKKRIVLENNSKVIAAGSSKSAISGLSISLLYLDEFAKIPDHLADDFIKSVFPVIFSSQTGRIVISSTPVGLNHWYDIWIKAVRDEKSDFYPIKIHWWELPWGTEEWKENIIRQYGKKFFLQEFACSFIGSTSTLIDPDSLERLSFIDPIDYRFGYNLNIYEYPIDKQKYIISVDTGKGTSRDSSVIQVLKINSKRSVEQVAVYRSNTISTANFSEICISVSQMYNEAEIMLENNDIGSSVADMIWYHHEYDKILNLDPKGLGIRSTRATKLKGNLLLKKYVEKRWVKIVDKVTIEELSRYVEEDGKNNVFSAEGNFHDDAVTSLIWGIFYLECKFFDGIDDSGGPVIALENQIEPPIVIFSNGATPDLDDENIKFLEEGGNFSQNLGLYN